MVDAYPKCTSGIDAKALAQLFLAHRDDARSRVEGCRLGGEQRERRARVVEDEVVEFLIPRA